MNKKLLIVASLATATLFSCLSANASDRTVIQNKGSDTLVNVAQAWAEHYREVKPDVATGRFRRWIQVTGHCRNDQRHSGYAQCEPKMKSKGDQGSKEKRVRTRLNTWLVMTRWRFTSTRPIRLDHSVSNS